MLDHLATKSFIAAANGYVSAALSVRPAVS